jgi:long-chain fatty acid transport protein
VFTGGGRLISVYVGQDCLRLRQAQTQRGHRDQENADSDNIDRITMSDRQNTRLAFVFLAAWALGPLAAHAVGYRMPNQDPEAIARGNAFAATADNPSAIYYNPAGITQMDGNNIDAGLYVVTGGYTYESPTGTKVDAKSEFVPVPQLFYVYSPQELPLSFGLGMYAPYGLSLDWGENTPFRTLAEKGSLTYLTINPVIAWKIHPALSIGIGPTINYSSADFQQGIGLVPNDTFRLKGDGWDYGFNAGLRWQPLEKWAFGINYRSATTVDYEGTAATAIPFVFSGTTLASARIQFPQYVVGGLSFRPTEDWNLEFNLDWTDWDSVHQISINTPSGSTPLLLNYRSSFMYEIGVTRQLGKGYWASLGYFYSENSSPDKNFTPIIPDTDLHLGGIGFGHKGKHWDWAAAYQFGYCPGRTVSGDTSPLADGIYKVFNNAFNLSATLKF